MYSRALVKGGAICFALLNVVLLVVLIGSTVYKFPSTPENKNNELHKYGNNTTIIVNQALRFLAGVSRVSGITKVREDLARLYIENGNLRKPAIHLRISDVVNTEVKEPILLWRDLSNTTFWGEGVHYTDGTVTVTYGGYYYIYSSIRYSGEGTAELEYGRIIHRILMKKASEMEESPTTLMQNLQSTPTIRRGRLAYTTSTLGSTFYLPPNSKVMMTSSIPKNIDTSPFGSYFGLFLV